MSQNSVLRKFHSAAEMFWPKKLVIVWQRPGEVPHHHDCTSYLMTMNCVMK